MSDGKDLSKLYFLCSVARITDFATSSFDVGALPRDDWDTGDYIATRVIGKPNRHYKLELPNGRVMSVMEGDLAVGALGKRAATLEGVGDWEAIGEDGLLHALTGAGLFGKATSMAPLLPDLMSLTYLGHVMRDGKKLNMRDFVTPVPGAELEAPVVLLVGTSMSAGKTTTGRVIIHEMKKVGLRIVGAKLTGAARYRDVLTYGDAGADAIVDFVDAGLPSTVVPTPRFREAMDHMLAHIAALGPDLVVAEAGASPIEPYNGETAISALHKRIAFLVLSASDPYAVVGVQTAFGLVPNLVTGPAANTTSGIELVRKLTGVPALNLLDPSSLPTLRELLEDAMPKLLTEAFPQTDLNGRSNRLDPG